MAKLALLSFVSTNEGIIVEEKFDNVFSYSSDKEYLNIQTDSFGNEFFCTKDKETNLGICKQYFQGIEKFAYTHKNTIKEGVYLEFYEETSITKIIIQCKDGKPHGLARYFHPNGVLATQSFFTSGKIHGLCTVFRPDGTKFREIYFNYGNSYFIIEFNTNGFLHCMYDVKDNQIHGIYKQFFENGLMKVEVPYVNGKPYGIEKSYNVYGSLISEINYINGIREGSCTYYNSEGELLDAYLYCNGNPIRY